MPNVATPPPTCSRPRPSSPTSTATGWSSTTRPASATPPSATWPGRRRSRPTTRRRSRPSGWSGRRARPSVPVRRASRRCTRPGPAARSRIHGPGHQPAGPDLRHGPDRLRGRRRGRRRGGHPRARPERADLHVPAAGRLRDLCPRRRHRGRLARAGLHPGRPLPVQRQEVRRRPRGDDRGDPARLPARDRCRLPQHRHRFLDAGRPVEAERRRGAARELPRARPS